MEEVFDKTPLFLLRSEMRSHSAEETIQIAEQYAKSLQKGDVVLLCGEMGAGKTVFVKGLAQGLGIADEITSDTFFKAMKSIDDFLIELHKPSLFFLSQSAANLFTLSETACS